MKIIISHDVDHLTPWEHWNSLFLPKHIVRSFIEAICCNISSFEVIARFRDIARNQWNNIDELMEFDACHGIPATFFVAVGNGRDLEYSLDRAKFWIRRIREKGFDVGTHGIAYDDISGVLREYTTFKEASKMDVFGVRMHDIGTKAGDVIINGRNLDLLDKTGYLFSSNTFQWRLPFRTGRLWEFPVNIMDGYLFFKNGRWQNRSAAEAVREAGELLREAARRGLPYFTILFHDIFFSRSFKDIKEWYSRLVEHCEKYGWSFIGYREAVKELESQEFLSPVCTGAAKAD
jgi:hypothetical protein